MIKRYTQFIKEADETTEAPVEANPKPEEKKVDNTKYTELKDELKSMIEKTIEKSGGEFDSFKEKFIKSPEDVKIEGLINDSDIYDFYLKFRNDIDELLNDINFFDEIPSESNTFGLYDYIINGTERASLEAIKML